MKFYRDKYALYDLVDDKYYSRIKDNKLTAIYCDYIAVNFYKNGNHHNTKNVAYIRRDGSKGFYLDNKRCGNEKDFTKKSWRRFVELRAFL